MRHNAKASFPAKHNGPAPEDGPLATQGETPADPVSVRAVVVQTCLAIAQDPGSPSAARVQAARTLAEMAGLLGKVQTTALDTGETRDSEMTAEDIDRELARLSVSMSRK